MAEDGPREDRLYDHDAPYDAKGRGSSEYRPAVDTNGEKRYADPFGDEEVGEVKYITMSWW